MRISIRVFNFLVESIVVVVYGFVWLVKGYLFICGIFVWFFVVFC